MSQTLTKARRAALFVVGTVGTWKKYGTWGPRYKAPLRVWFLYEAKLAEHVPIEESEVRDVRLTAAGQSVFDALFTKCPEHGWEGPVNLGGGKSRTYETCSGCCTLIEQVWGFTPTPMRELRMMRRLGAVGGAS